MWQYTGKEKVLLLDSCRTDTSIATSRTIIIPVTQKLKENLKFRRYYCRQLGYPEEIHKRFLAM